MGGKGSGRPPSAETIIKRSQPIAQTGGENIFIPNYSGVKHEIKEGTHNISTDDLAEGSTNLYFTDARAVSAVSSDDAYLKNTGDTGTGDYTFDTSTLKIDSTNHRVGIGTTSPATKLQVNSDGAVLALQKATNEPGNIYFDFRDYSGAEKGYFGYGSSTDNFYIANLLASDMIFWNHGEVMRIDSSGNVGIGTASPGTPLHVKGTWGSGNGTIKLEDPSTGIVGISFYQTTNYKGWLAYGNAAGKLELQNYSGGGGGDVLINPNYGGNVGIGTSSPGAKLVIEKPSTGQALSTTANASAIFAGDYNIGRGGAIGFDYGIGGAGHTYYPVGIGYYVTNTGNSTYGDLVFSTRSVNTDTVSSERMRITSGGDVGIGTTSPSTKLHVSGQLTLSNQSAPSTPTNAGALFVSGGECWFIGSSGTQTKLANA